MMHAVDAEEDEVNFYFASGYISDMTQAFPTSAFLDERGYDHEGLEKHLITTGKDENVRTEEIMIDECANRPSKIDVGNNGIRGKPSGLPVDGRGSLTLHGERNQGDEQISKIRRNGDAAPPLRCYASRSLPVDYRGRSHFMINGKYID